MSWTQTLSLSLAAVLGAFEAGPSAAAPSCSMHSAATTRPVVELYTSEGCSSCPPADLWLSQTGPSVVALAFHVDYWDRLGWKDRFASPAFTQRQAEQRPVSGARFSYTPQVIVDGADRPDWPRLGPSIAARSRTAAQVDVQLMREGSGYKATVAPSASAPPRLAAYWAVTEQGFVSEIKAGENDGATLRHDHVVREYRPVAAWASKPGNTAQTLQFEPAGRVDPAHARDVNLVIVDAGTGRPLQAVKLGC